MTEIRRMNGTQGGGYRVMVDDVFVGRIDKHAAYDGSYRTVWTVHLVTDDAEVCHDMDRRSFRTRKAALAALEQASDWGVAYRKHVSRAMCGALPVDWQIDPLKIM